MHRSAGGQLFSDSREVEVVPPADVGLEAFAAGLPASQHGLGYILLHTTDPRVVRTLLAGKY